MSTTESDGDLLARLGVNGEAWAAEFVKLHGPHGDDTGQPGDNLHGWFCNAIEAGVSQGYASLIRNLVAEALDDGEQISGHDLEVRLGAILARHPLTEIEVSRVESQ